MLNFQLKILCRKIHSFPRIPIDADGKLINKILKRVYERARERATGELVKLTPNIVFCRPNGIGVRRANRTTLKALGPDITRRIARPVSVFINL